MALQHFAAGIAAATASLFDYRIAALERDLEALLDLILEHGDAAVCDAVREYIAERQPSVH